MALQRFELMRNEHSWHLFLSLVQQVEQTIWPLSHYKVSQHKKIIKLDFERFVRIK